MNKRMSDGSENKKPQNSQQLWKATKENLRTTVETEKVFHSN